MPELLVHMDAPSRTIHEPVPDLQELPRAQVEAYLANVAKALIEGWGDELEEMCDHSRYQRDAEDHNKLEELLADFKATENCGGIMKSSVMVNHQWVIKLGQNAILEMQEYADHEGTEYGEQLVPTVWLGDVGCLALKVEVPVINSDYYCFDDSQHEEWYHEFKDSCGVPDMHRGNVGVWQDQMVAIDWGGGC